MTATVFFIILLALVAGLAGLAAILSGFYNSNEYTLPFFDHSREPKGFDAELDRIAAQYRR